ncbi:MAG: TAXI family TRAP transporter solute-binding subunit [Deltaproteobacteria bacterium]|nr:TAXI family TRAP transporter solute-binding subunit [Deltaproteobacteria bacterium]
MKRRWILLLAMVFIIGLVVGGPVSAAQKLPRILNLATMPPGMIVNAQGVGIADMVSKYTPMSIKVMPATNEMVWMPMTVTGEIDLGVTASLPTWQAYHGTFVFEGIAKKAKVKGFPVRVVTGGSPLRVNFVVRGDDPAKTCADLKGRRVVCFRERTQFDLYTKARLANGGLTIKDVKCVPAANPIESARAVMEGRADAGDLAVGAPIATEAVAKVKARWLSMDPSPEAVKRMKEYIKTAYVAKTPGGVFIGVPEDQYLMNMDVILVAVKSISEAAVYNITKILWERNDELVKRPGLMEWKRERFVTQEPRLPYHEGAIKFYKEKGIWTKEMDEFQKARLAEEPK